MPSYIEPPLSLLFSLQNEPPPNNDTLCQHLQYLFEVSQNYAVNINNKSSLDYHEFRTLKSLEKINFIEMLYNTSGA